MTRAFGRPFHPVVVLVLSGCVLSMAGAAGSASLAAEEATRAPLLACPPCDDGDACTTDACDEVTGVCRHDPVTCYDANPCTEDRCDRATGCAFEPLAPGTACDDLNVCTLETTCDESARCVGRSEAAGVPCDDRDPCTEGDICDGAGGCLGVPKAPGSQCDDLDLCTSGETCVETAPGSLECVGTPKDCADNTVCTRDSCDRFTGECVHAQVVCPGDGNACTADFCSNAGGGCVHVNQEGAPCNDHNACTLGDRLSCNNGQLTCAGPFPQICDDGGSLCVRTSCDPAVGCVFTVKDCDDHNPCTEDGTCSGGLCPHRALSGPCDDGDPCTTGDQCVLVNSVPTCRGTSPCDDGNVCTDDQCDPLTPGGCFHADNDVTCNDGNLCTTGDRCAGGACAGAPRNCDDGFDCTRDSCDPASGCAHTPDDARCEDGNPCTSDRCTSSGCVHGPAAGPDADADGIPDACDNCPRVSNRDQADRDRDTVGDLCDVCPLINNPDQNPCECYECIPLSIFIGFDSPSGKGAGRVRWETGIEHDVAGFNVVVYDHQGNRSQQNEVLIPCNECVTDRGSYYEFIIPKHKSGRNVFVEQVRRDGFVGTFGPATRE